MVLLEEMAQWMADCWWGERGSQKSSRPFSGPRVGQQVVSENARGPFTINGVKAPADSILNLLSWSVA